MPRPCIELHHTRHRIEALEMSGHVEETQCCEQLYMTTGDRRMHSSRARRKRQTQTYRSCRFLTQNIQAHARLEEISKRQRTDSGCDRSELNSYPRNLVKIVNARTRLLPIREEHAVNVRKGNRGEVITNFTQLSMPIQNGEFRKQPE